MTEPTPAPRDPGSPAAPRDPGSGTVSLREFAAQVPMPYTTAREWTESTPRRPALIHATRTPTGRLLVTLDQLPAVRAALAGTPAPAPEVAP